MKKSRNSLTPCGLDCARCSIHLRTEEELEYWRKQSVDLRKIRCDGCRSDRQGAHWSPDCKILQCCVYDKGLEFCAQCGDFPCSTIKEWIGGYKHHGEAVARLMQMKQQGVDQWIAAYLTGHGEGDKT